MKYARCCCSARGTSERCYVDASSFPGPRALAEYIAGIGDDEYERFHAWRGRTLQPGLGARCALVAEHPLVRLARAVPVIGFGRRAAARRRAGADADR